MMKRFFTVSVRLLLAATFLLGCGKKHEARSPEDVVATESAGRVEPASESERAILKSLDKLPAGQAQTVGREQVTASAPYFAASGAHCREVSWGKEQRLACREAEGWYFVPDVLGAAGPP